MQDHPDSSGEDSIEYDLDDVEHARERRLFLDNLIYDLNMVAKNPGTAASPEEKEFLEDARQTIACGYESLKELLDRSEDPGKRGDDIDLVASIVEATFVIGRLGATSVGAALLARSQTASKAAKAGADKRRWKAALWQDVCRVIATECRTAEPGLAHDRFVEKICSQWPTAPEMPAFKTISKFVKLLERNGELSKKIRASKIPKLHQ